LQISSPFEIIRGRREGGIAEAGEQEEKLGDHLSETRYHCAIGVGAKTLT